MQICTYVRVFHLTSTEHTDGSLWNFIQAFKGYYTLPFFSSQPLIKPAMRYFERESGIIADHISCSKKTSFTTAFVDYNKTKMWQSREILHWINHLSVWWRKSNYTKGNKFCVLELPGTATAWWCGVSTCLKVVCLLCIRPFQAEFPKKNIYDHSPYHKENIISPLRSFR
jgi:hypothetical protein